MLPKESKSLWTATSSQTNYPEFKGNKDADVIIIGGGIAGINAAYFLINSGFKVIILESSYIISGTSGNTTAKITSQHNLIYDNLIKNFGNKKAKMYADANEWAIKEFENIILREKIKCDFRRLPAYTFAWGDKCLKQVKDEIAASQKLGLPASLLEVSQDIPAKAKGGIKFDNQACFHPRKFLLQIAKIIIDKGGEIYEKSKVTEVIPGETARVKTENGSINAKFAIVATNYPVFDKAKIFMKMNQKRSYVLAASVENNLPNGVYISADEPMLSFRPHIDGNKKWLLIGGESHMTGNDENAAMHFVNLEKLARTYFKIKSTDYKWAAQDSISFDRVPFIGRMPQTNNIFVTTGYRGWGMTTSLVSAKLLTDLIKGNKNEWEEFFSPERLAKPQGNKMIEMAKGLFAGYGRQAKKKKFDYSELSPGEGEVIKFNNQQVAVYKDEEAKIHSVSAICTHMGCTVNWNNEEKTWDCPCHGSRFNIEGDVLNGPAVKKLEQIDIK